MKCILLFTLSLSALSNFLPHSFRVTMTEKASKLGNSKAKFESGQLDYMYPSHVRFKKKYTEFVANKKTTWTYSKPFIATESGKVSISQSSNKSIFKIFDALKNGLKSNSIYKVNKSNEHSYFLDFSASGKKDYNIKSVVLNFDPSSNKLHVGSVRKMSITYTDQKLVDITLDSYDGSVSFNEKYFVFKIPPNTQEI